MEASQNNYHPSAWFKPAQSEFCASAALGLLQLALAIGSISGDAEASTLRTSRRYIFYC
jgi:hypothetical protein